MFFFFLLSYVLFIRIKGNTHFAKISTLTSFVFNEFDGNGLKKSMSMLDFTLNALVMIFEGAFLEKSTKSFTRLLKVNQVSGSNGLFLNRPIVLCL